MADGCAGADLVHSHTWYANLGRPPRPGCCTASRTWSPRTRSSRCGRGRPSSSAAATRSRRWVERTAYEGADAVIAVSRRRCAPTSCDCLPRRRPGPGARRPQRHRHRAWYRAGPDPDARRASSASTRTGRSVVFVGRITRQKGLPLPPARRRRSCRPTSSSCCCAGAPDTPEIEAEVARPRRRRCAATRDGRRLDRARCCPAPTWSPAAHRTRPSFVCPSVYEPLGIVNLEAMACETAVVATATGGIPEVVVRRRDRPAGADRAGHRRHRHAAGPRPVRRRPRRRAQRGGRRPRPGRARWAGPGGSGPIDAFSWAAIAEQTLEVYRSVGA